MSPILETVSEFATEPIEGPPEDIPGLGVLDVETVLTGDKALRQVAGTALDQAFTGFEMHMGVTSGPDCRHPFALLGEGRPDGATSADRQVTGTYVHGAFASTALRSALLGMLGAQSDGIDHDAKVDDALNAIAAELEHHLDVDGLLKLAMGKDDA